MVAHGNKLNRMDVGATMTYNRKWAHSALKRAIEASAVLFQLAIASIGRKCSK